MNLSIATCPLCGAPATLQVMDTFQPTSGGAYVPVNNNPRFGCNNHPPVALQIAFGGATTLVPPSGYAIGSGGSLTS
jgi:hypothetical protein